MIYGLRQRSRMLALTLLRRSPTAEQSESEVLGKPPGWCVCWTRRGRNLARARIRRVERRFGAKARKYHADLAARHAGRQRKHRAQIRETPRRLCRVNSGQSYANIGALRRPQHKPGFQTSGR